MLAILPLMFILFGIGITFALLQILLPIFIAGVIALFIAFAILLTVLSRKNFFTKYKSGWKRTASKLVKIGIIGNDRKCLLFLHLHIPKNPFTYLK